MPHAKHTEKMQALDNIVKHLQGRSFAILSGGPSDDPAVQQRVREERSRLELHGRRVQAEARALAALTPAERRASETAAWRRELRAELARPRHTHIN